MSNIEERIVQLTLNSKDFEKNTKTSIAALEKLDEALKLTGSKQSLQDLQASVNAVDFSKLSDNVDRINKRFSALGIATATVIANLTNKATDFGLKMLNAINPVTQSINLLNKGLNQVKTGGWTRATNIDQAKFKIEGLGQDWEKVEKRISYGVDNTAYSFDQAANAASQLVASGVQMSDVWDEKNVDDLGRALRAISGAAAMTGANYDLLADVFIDSAAAGKVTADAFNRLAWQGLNAKSTLAKALNKTQAEIDEMSRKGQISFQMFADAMDEAYGEQATKSNETFEGSLANMKSALSRIGQEFATPIRAAGTSLFNAVRKQINNLKTALKNAKIFDNFQVALEKGVTAVVTLINSIPTEAFDTIANAAGVAVGIIANLAEGIDSLISRIPWLAKKEEDQAKDTAESITNVVDAEAKVIELANEVLTGKYGNGQERIEALGKAFKVVQNMVNEMLDHPFRYDLADDETAEAVFGVAEATDEATKATAELREEQEKLNSEQKVLVHSPLGSYYATKEVPNAEKAATVFEGLASALDVLKNTGKAIGAGAKDNIVNLGKAIGQGFLDAGYAISNWTIKFRTWLEETGAYEKITNKVNEVTGWLVDKLKSIGGFGKKSFGVIQNAAGKVWDVLGQAKGRVSEFFTSFKDTAGYKRLETVFTSIRDRVIEIKDSAVKALTDAINSFMGTKFTLPEFDADSFAASVSDKIEWLLDKIELIKTRVSEFFVGNAEEGTGGVFGFIKSTLGDVSFQSAVDWANNSLGTLKDELLAFLGVFTGSSISRSATAGLDGIEQVITEEQKVSEIISPKLQNAIDALVTFKDNIVTVGQQIIEAVMNIITTFVGLFTGETVVDESIVEPWMGEMATDYIGDEAEKVSKAVEGVKSTFDSVKETILGFAADIAEAISPLTENMPTSLSDVIDIAHNVVDTVKDFAKDIAIIGGYRALWHGSGIVKGLSKITNNVGKFIDNASEIPTKLKEFISGFSKSIQSFVDGLNKNLTRLAKAESRLRNAKAILLVAAAIAVLAGAIFALGQLKPSQLDRALHVIVVIGIILAALFAVIGHYFGTNNVKQVQAGPDALAKALDACKAIFKNFLKNIGKAALITSIGVTIALIGGVIMMLGNMDWKAALRGVGFLAAIILGLVGAVHLLGKIGADEESQLKMSMAFIMLFMALAVKALAGTIEKLGSMDTGVLIKGGIAVSVLMLVISKAVKDMNTIPKDAQQKGGISKILALGMLILAIKSLAKTVKMLGEMDLFTLGKGIIAVDIIAIILRRLITSNMKVQPKTFGAYLGLTIILSAMAIIVKKLGELDIFTLGKGLIAIGLLSLILKGMLNASYGLNSKALFAFAGIALVVGTVAASLYALSNIDPYKLKTASKSLRSAMLMVGLAFSSIMAMTKYQSKGQMLATFIPMIGIIAAVAVSLGVLSGQDTKGLRTAARSIKRVFVAMGTFTKQFSKMKNTAGTTGKAEVGRITAYFVAIGALLLVIVGALHLVKDIPSSQLLIMGTALSAIFASFGMLAQGIGALSGIGGGFASAFGHSFGGIVGFFTGLVTIAALAAGLDKVTDGALTQVVEGATEFFGALGKLLGSFLGGLLTGALEDINKSLGSFGTNFDAFITKLVELGTKIIGVEGGESEFMTGIEALSEFMDALKDVAWDAFAAGVGSKFANYTADDISKFMDNMVALAPSIPALVAAFKEGKTYGELTVEDAETTATNITSIGQILSAIGRLGWSSFGSGFLSWVANTNFGSITKFTDNLVTLAPHVYTLSNRFKQIKNTSGMVTRADAFTLANQLEGIRAVVQAIGDTADLENASGWSAFLGSEQKISDMNEFVDNLTEVAGPVYLLADAFEHISIKNKEGKVINTIDADPGELANKISLVRDIVEAVGETAWVSEAAGWHADRSIDNITDIQTFCDNLAAVAGPAYTLADTFVNGEEIGTDVKESQIGTLESQLRAVMSVLRVISELGYTSTETGEYALDALNDVENIRDFCTNLTSVAKPTYDVAYMFSTLTTSDGATIENVDTEDIKEKLTAVLSVIEAIGSLGKAVGFAGITINDSGDEETTNAICEFCQHVATIAPDAYKLAAAFETTEINGMKVHVNSADLAEKLQNVTAVTDALAVLGSVTLAAGIQAKSNLNSTSIADITKFCEDMLPLADPTLKLASMFDSVEVDDSELEGITAESVATKLGAIAAVVEGVGTIGKGTIKSGIISAINEIGGGDDGGWSLTAINDFITHMKELEQPIKDIVSLFNGDNIPKLDGKTIMDTMDSLIDEDAALQDSDFEPIQAALRGLNSLAAIGNDLSIDGLNKIAGGGDYAKRFAEGIGGYFTAIEGIKDEQKIIDAQPIIDGIISSMNTIEKGAAQNAGSLANVLPNVGTAIASFITNTNGASFEDAAKMATDLASFVSGLNSIWNSAGGNWEVMPETLDPAFSYLGLNIKATFDQVKALISGGTYDDVLTGVGEALMKAIVRGMIMSPEDMSTMVDNMFSTKASPMQDGGKVNADEFVLGFKKEVDICAPGAGEDVAAAMNENVVPAVENTDTSFEGAVETIMDAMRLKMNSYRWRITETLASVLNAAVRIGRTFQKDFSNIGLSLMQGMAAGIRDNASLVTDAAQKVAQDTEGITKKEVDSNSPSKKFIKIGSYLMQGLRIGILDNEYMPLSAAESSAASIVRAMSDSIETEVDTSKQQLFNSLVGLYAYTNMALQEALDTQPTITPVMDLSMIQNGANSINGMLSGYSLGTGSLSYARNMFPGTSVYSSQAHQQAISAATVQGIREDIRSLGSAISNMQMVLDSGTLVGSIGGGMDRELGSIQKLRERWA